MAPIYGYSIAKAILFTTNKISEVKIVEMKSESKDTYANNVTISASLASSSSNKRSRLWNSSANSKCGKWNTLYKGEPQIGEIG